MRFKIDIRMFARKLPYKYYKLEFTMIDLKSRIEIAENWNSGGKLGASSKLRLEGQMKGNADQDNDVYGW